MSAWKPGDIGVNLTHGYRGIYVESCRIAEHGRAGGPCWHNESGMADPGKDLRRPLVVIDPEDAEQVERLVRLLINAESLPNLGEVGATQAALREFANPKPPKPDEPTGLGAVVRDAEGILYVRAPERDGVVWRGTGTWIYKDWATIDAVEVLSEGVIA